jgi:hypothetical protein
MRPKLIQSVICSLLKGWKEDNNRDRSTSQFSDRMQFYMHQGKTGLFSSSPDFRLTVSAIAFMLRMKLLIYLHMRLILFTLFDGCHLINSNGSHRISASALFAR